ncbi:MAG: hypothetical protein WBQ43_07485 [Terriglobales bacterium]
MSATHDDVVKRRNLVANAKHHSPHDGEGQKEADRGEEEAAAGTVGDMFAQKRAQARAMKQP